MSLFFRELNSTSGRAGRANPLSVLLLVMPLTAPDRTSDPYCTCSVESIMTVVILAWTYFSYLIMLKWRCFFSPTCLTF